MGRNTIADSYASVSLGAYNATIPGSNSPTWVATDPVFTVGVGTSDMNRKNAVTILKNGKIGINTISPLANLHVADSSVVFTGPFPLPEFR
ncbi:MAG: hypothetical protein IPK25_00135 [Saprospiraceae bacterium]|nr:hypothetical protein [Saprospiraceae bacterium]